MPEPITRDRIIEALREMPADATIKDAIERLVVLARVEAGLGPLVAGPGVQNRLAGLMASGAIRLPSDLGTPIEWPDIALPKGTASSLIDLDRNEEKD